MTRLSGSAGAREIRARLAALRAAGRALRQRPREQSLDSLARLLDLFAAPDSPPRDELVRELAPSSGFSAPVLREGLRRALAPWTGAALRELVEQELGPSSEPQRGRVALGFGVTTSFLAGAIPMPALLSMCAPLLLGSPVLIKTAAGDRITAHRVASALAALDPELGRCVAVVDFAGDDALCAAASCEADCVVASGSDESVAAIRARVQPWQRFVAHGHRFSLAVLGPGALGEGPLAEVAERIALDVALWDQLGCLSPLAVHTVGAAPGAAVRVAAELARALALAEKRLPRGSAPAAALALASHELAEAELRAAGGAAVRVFRGSGGSFAVIAEADARPRPAPLYRFLRVHPVADSGALEEALAPLGAHLAAVAVAGFGSGDPAVARRLLGLGASRICQPGELQTPPLSWPRDGQPVLRCLAREGASELPADPLVSSI